MTTAPDDLRSLGKILNDVYRAADRQIQSEHSQVDLNATNLIVLLDGLATSAASDHLSSMRMQISQSPISAAVIRISYAGAFRSQYAVFDTSSPTFAPRHSQTLEDFFLLFKRVENIAIVGYSLGGIVAAHFLCNDYFANTWADKIRCAVIIGSPLEPGTLLVQGLAEGSIRNYARAELISLLKGYEANSRELYLKFPNVLQIHGTLDAIATARRSGLESRITYPVPPLIVQGADHMSLPSHDSAIQATMLALQCSLVQQDFGSLNSLIAHLR